ncbi:hypothetical protein DMB38_20415 [Streptomyces sp. WAC 06738]|uniref:hypothetical protein n=1 Tax=Streptomyces sp. WAC 06738 TaxID=2203210 RepID=UPI000F6F7DD4|nr:hypothetical protein [Streptomyces sp. WAC 06738]AZM47836.1 hypothetical protein DMB38_20415 [Streptomyces sp. WAC 06738]
MARLDLAGTVRSTYLQQVRGLHMFQVERPVTLLLERIYVEPIERLVWMECHQGSWRLPAKTMPWAEAIESRAREIVGYDEVLPCPIVFAPKANGEFEMELRPRGYRPFLDT